MSADPRQKYSTESEDKQDKNDKQHKEDEEDKEDMVAGKKEKDRFVLPHLIEGAQVNWTVATISLKHVNEYKNDGYYVITDTKQARKNLKPFVKYCSDRGWEHPIVFTNSKVESLRIVEVSIFIRNNDKLRGNIGELKSKLRLLIETFNYSEKSTKELEDVAREETAAMQSLFEKNESVFYQILVSKEGQHFVIELANNDEYIKFCQCLDYDVNDMITRIRSKYIVKREFKNSLDSMSVHPILLRSYVPIGYLSDENRKVLSCRPCILLYNKGYNEIHSFALKVTKQYNDDNRIKTLRFEIPKRYFEVNLSPCRQIVVATSCFGGCLDKENNKHHLDFNKWTEGGDSIVLNEKGQDFVKDRVMSIIEKLVFENCAMGLPEDYLLRDDISFEVNEQEMIELYEAQQQAAMLVDEMDEQFFATGIT